LLLALAAVAIILGISIASLVVVYPYLEEQYFGPAPIWHPFGPVFTSSGQLASESCSLENLQGVLQGVGGYGKLSANSVVLCSFHGATYEGLFGTDCNLTPTGPIPSINGTLIPYEGCVLSTAPLNYTFTGIYTLGAKSSESIAVYSNRTIVANMTPTETWKSFHCSLTSDNVTKSNGAITCEYLGVLYAAGSITQRCNLGTAIEVYGVPVPVAACNLDRSDRVVP
jgi:hypothetical protein